MHHACTYRASLTTAVHMKHFGESFWTNKVFSWFQFLFPVMKRPSENDEIFGWDRNGFWKDEHIIVSEYLLIFSALLCCSLLIQHFTGHVWKCQYLPEAAATMMLGMTISLTIRLAGGYDISAYEEDHFDATFLGFSPNVFFFAFLPPIIFNRSEQSSNLRVWKSCHLDDRCLSSVVSWHGVISLWCYSISLWC